MSNAEDRALEKYPYAEICREKYLEGYHQAEKDLELSSVDVMIILDIAIKILRECNNQKELIFKAYEGEGYYDEILKRFKEINGW